MRQYRDQFNPKPRPGAVTAHHRPVAKPSPPFADSEAKELLETYGAPPSWLNEKAVALLNGSASGHATLLVAGIRYLRDRQWRLNEREWTEIFGARYAENLRSETAQRLVDLIGDGETRDLLYRLNLSIVPFTEDDALNIGTVEPSIARPGERLQALLVICVQSDSSGKLRVAPIFKALGTGDVPTQSLPGCHAALGTGLMRRKTVTTNEAGAAVIHLLAAGDPNRAAIVLLQGLISLAENDRTDGGILTAIWCEMPIPDSIDLGLQIVIRANQVRVLHKADKKDAVQYSLADMEKMLDHAGEKDAWATLLAGVTVQQTVAQISVRRANRLLSASLNAFPTVRAAMGSHWKLGTINPEALFWANAASIASSNDLDDWICALNALSKEQRERVFDSDIAAEGCWHVADKVWLGEDSRPESERNWQHAFATLARLAAAGERWRQPALVGCAVRGQIIVLAEYLKDLEAAVTLADQTLLTLGEVGSAKYPICECLGRQYKYRKDFVGATRWLYRSLDEAGEHWPLHRVDTLMLLASFLANEEAPILLKQAVEIATKEPTPQLTLVRAKGELGLALWRCDRRAESVHFLDEAVDHLSNARNEDEDKAWTATAAQFGHYISYFMTILQTGMPPDQAADGSTYAEPRIGMLGTLKLDVADWAKAVRMSQIYMLMAETADSLGEREIATRRAIQAFDLARKENDLITISVMGYRRSPVLAAEDQFSDAIDIALQSAIAIRALMVIDKEGDNHRPTNRTVAEVLGSKPSENWSVAEYEALRLGGFPVALRLCAISLRDQSRAATAATEVAAVCRTVASSASNAELWIELSDLFRDAFVNPISGDALLEIGNNAKKKQFPVVFQAIAYLAASLRPACTTENAAITQLYVIAESKILAPPDGAAYQRLVLPFLQG